MIEHCSALVTGANRGIGFEVARQLVTLGFHVIISARKKLDAIEAAEKLKLAEGKKASVIGVQLDVNSEKSILSAKRALKGHFVGIIVNNAAIFPDDPRNGISGNIFNLPIDLFQQVLDTNLLGALRVIQAFIPDMIERGFGRVVNVSSGMGQPKDFDNHSPYYRLSKGALIHLTRICALSSTVENIKINAVCPGWVQTRMGGKGATRSIEEGANGIVFAATLPKNGPSGIFLRDGKALD